MRDKYSPISRCFWRGDAGHIVVHLFKQEPNDRLVKKSRKNLEIEGLEGSEGGALKVNDFPVEFAANW